MPIEITDEMIRRGVSEWLKPVDGSVYDNVRRLLRAAISPVEPEILVTEEMHDAGWEAWCHSPTHRDMGRSKLIPVYRAMRKLEPKP